MTLFVRAESVGREPSVFSIREHFITFGTTHDGLLSSSEITTPWFSTFSVDDEYFLQVHLEEAPDANKTHLITRIEHGTKLELPSIDYTFTFALTQEEAAVLAAGNEIREEEIPNSMSSPNAFLSIQIAQTSKKFPLFDGAAFSLGSGDSDIMKISFDGVAEAHALIQQNGSNCTVHALNGDLRIEEVEIPKGTSTQIEAGECTLIPSEITFVISPVAA